MGTKQYRNMLTVRLALGKEDIQECPCGSTTFVRETSGQYAELERGSLCFEDFTATEVIANSRSVDRWVYRCNGCLREVLPWAP